MSNTYLKARWPIVLLLALFLWTPAADSYSVLTHEQIVDMAWKDHIIPAIQKRYPGTTAEQLKEAHAYAYGGCLIQDMGYYPFGNRHFSDLSHYVRSGDFVSALLREAQNANEYAFALGALAHYVSDTVGHPAVNHAVPIEFPKLQRKFGNTVTYEEDKKAHIRTEFGFDVLQVAKNRYTSDAYHNFVGFAVAKESLARAFQDTYGLDIGVLFSDEDHSIGTFRWAVNSLIPELTRVALKTREQQMMKEEPTFDRRKFLYRASRSSYERSWGKNYQHAGFGTRLLVFLVRILPKIGPLKVAKIKDPTPQTEQMYLKSVNDSVDLFQHLVDESASRRIELADKDFDTGNLTRPGEYRLTDETYAYLVHTLAEHHFDRLTPELRANILKFYADANTNPKLATKRDRKDWEQLQKELAELKAAQPETDAKSQQ